MKQHILSLVKVFKNSKNQSVVIKTGLALIFFFLSFSLQFVFLKNPDRMNRIFAKKTENLREIVSQMLKNDLKIRALTQKKGDMIRLKIFKVHPNGRSQLVNTVEVGRYEAFFEYGNESISLGIMDYNGDGSLEVIAAGFDKFFKPQVHIMEYNKSTEKFEPLKVTTADLNYNAP